MVKRRIKPTDKQIKDKKDKEESTQRLLRFYQEIWNERPHRSEISGVFLGKEIKTYFFHHILSKNFYKKMMFYKENIILLSWEEHNLVEYKKDSFPIINQKREELKKIYEFLV